MSHPFEVNCADQQNVSAERPTVSKGMRLFLLKLAIGNTWVAREGGHRTSIAYYETRKRFFALMIETGDALSSAYDEVNYLKYLQLAEIFGYRFAEIIEVIDTVTFRQTRAPRSYKPFV